MRRSLLPALALILFSSLSVAQVPEFNVVPNMVDEDLAAHVEHDLEFTFTNQDSSRDIYNVTLENTSYLSWEPNNFRLNASQTRTVNAIFYTENLTSINDTLSSSYRYNGSDNAFDGENISINVSTFFRNTSVNLSVFKSDFELGFGETESSVFTVENTGDEDAFKVELEGEDISFDRDSSFTVAEGEDELVQYDVEIPLPEENATAATNRTYNRTVRVSGENFNDTEFTVSVFVPFKQYDTEDAERNFADDIVQFCNDFPESKFCTGEEIVVRENNTRYVNNTPVYEANLTEEEKNALRVLANTRSEDYQDILDRVKLQQNTFRSELERTRGNFSENLDQVESETKENTEMIRSLNQSIVENNKRELQEARNRRFWMQLGVVILVLWLLARGVWFVYENWEEWSRDSRWSN